MKKNPFSMAVVLAITMFFCELAIFPLTVIFAWLSPLRTGKALFIAVMLLLFVITARGLPPCSKNSSDLSAFAV